MGTIARRASRLKDSRFISVTKATFKRYRSDGGSWLAVVLSYYGFLSLFPLILVGAGLIGIFVARDPAARLEWTIRLIRYFPGLGDEIGEGLAAVARRSTGAGIFGLVGLAWAGLRAMEAASYALGVVFRRPALESTIKQKLRALGSTGLIGSMALVGIGLSAAVGGVEVSSPYLYGVRAVGVVLSLAADFLVFLVAYRLLTPKPGPGFDRLWPGTLVAAGGWTVLKVVGSWYVAYATRSAGGTYGSFAAVVALLALLYLASRVFLYGAELNATLMEQDRSIDHRAEQPPKDPSARDTEEEQMRTQPNEPIVVDEQSDAGAGTLIKTIAADAGVLIKKEVELAKREVIDAISARLGVVGALVAAGILALFGLVFLGAALASALSQVMPAWAARALVGAGFLAVGAVAVLFSRMRAAHLTGLPKTQQSLKDDAEWARDLLVRDHPKKSHEKSAEKVSQDGSRVWP